MSDSFKTAEQLFDLAKNVEKMNKEYNEDGEYKAATKSIEDAAHRGLYGTRVSFKDLSVLARLIEKGYKFTVWNTVKHRDGSYETT